MKILVTGAAGLEDIPGLEKARAGADIVFATDEVGLRNGLPGTEILLSWSFRGLSLRDHWSLASELKWIHWCGAGVDAALFPELAASDVLLTNARGLFDRAMAEYVLGYMLSESKLLPATAALQQAGHWQHRLTTQLRGSKAVIFGVGSIGTDIARVLKALDVEVTGVGSSARRGDPVFGDILAPADKSSAVADADWVIGVLPLTAATENFFTAEVFAAMQPSARFINVGRGLSVDEVALLNALNENRIAGAMLDVFREEPLPADSPLWTAPNLKVSPHMSGDFHGYADGMIQQFLDNLDRYQANHELNNLVDKERGYARRPTS